MLYNFYSIYGVYSENFIFFHFFIMFNFNFFDFWIFFVLFFLKKIHFFLFILFYFILIFHIISVFQYKSKAHMIFLYTFFIQFFLLARDIALGVYGDFDWVRLLCELVGDLCLGWRCCWSRMSGLWCSGLRGLRSRRERESRSRFLRPCRWARQSHPVAPDSPCTSTPKLFRQSKKKTP